MKLDWHPPTVKPQAAHYRWGAAHSAIVHEGAVLSNGTVLPPRRFTDHAIAKTPIAATIAVRVQQGQSIDLAFRAAANQLNQAFTDAIESEIWEWPRSTDRRNGETVSSPRDIVDRGELRDSQSMHFEVG